MKVYEGAHSLDGALVTVDGKTAAAAPSRAHMSRESPRNRWFESVSLQRRV
jgi:hypothetical protein